MNCSEEASGVDRATRKGVVPSKRAVAPKGTTDNPTGKNLPRSRRPPPHSPVRRDRLARAGGRLPRVMAFWARSGAPGPEPSRAPTVAAKPASGEPCGRSRPRELASADGGRQRPSPCTVWAGHYQGLGGMGGSERPGIKDVSADPGGWRGEMVACIFANCITGAVPAWATGRFSPG